jgi:magnesium chelatase family protein
MIGKDSRYAKSILYAGGGEEFLGARPRIDNAPRPDDRFHTVKEGDRIDLIVDVPTVPVVAIADAAPGESSESVRHRVLAARAVQRHRYGAAGPRTNAELRGNPLTEICRPDADGRDLLRQAVPRFGLSARGYSRVLKVARTIADLEGEAHIGARQIAEALQYRVVERGADAGNGRVV